MPYLEESTPLTPLIDINGTASSIDVSDRHDSVFISDPSPDISSSASSSDTLCPSHEGALEVLKGNPLKGMERSTPLTP